MSKSLGPLGWSVRVLFCLPKTTNPLRVIHHSDLLSVLLFKIHFSRSRQWLTHRTKDTLWVRYLSESSIFPYIKRTQSEDRVSVRETEVKSYLQEWILIYSWTTNTTSIKKTGTHDRSSGGQVNLRVRTDC